MRFLAMWMISAEPNTRGDDHIAASVALEYGKGSGHPARLNFGDCLVYGVAIDRRLPLLFAGHDFSRTPIERVLK